MMIVLCVTGFLMVRKIIVPSWVNQWWVNSWIGDTLTTIDAPNWMHLSWRRDP